MNVCFRVLCVGLCAAMLCGAATAADGETLIGTEYCFSAADFAVEEATPGGIFVTQVPQEAQAVLLLEDRVIRAGDVLPADVLDRLRLRPVCKENFEAVFAYQPVCGRSLGAETALTIRIHSGKNEAPTATPQSFETYKNIANDGKLTGTDPEQEALTFQLAEAPRRGTVELKADGTYLYTPEKNKVGEDSFTFTVTDAAGNVSAPARVSIRILKPADAMTFGDMAGSTSHFEALWLREQGLSSGRTIAGTLCFCPEETVGRGEFLVMAMELQGIDVDEAPNVACFADAAESPAWLQPYLATALQRGIIRGEVQATGLVFRPNDPITTQEAAVVLQNILKLPVSTAAVEHNGAAWAAASLQALEEAGLPLAAPEAALTRLQAANLLWQVSRMQEK